SHGNERISSGPKGVITLEQAGHPAIPQHRLEVPLEGLAARVVSARHILRVILVVDENRTGREPGMLLDERQFTRHLALNHLGYCDVRIGRVRSDGSCKEVRTLMTRRSRGNLRSRGDS